MKTDNKIGVAPYLLGMAAFAISVAVAVYLSYWQSMHELEKRADVIAGEVLGRSHSISDQMSVALRALEDQPGAAPCSPASIRLMRRLALGASYLQVVGYVQGDRLLCSSYGHHGQGIPLGPPDYLSRLGYFIRTSVHLPMAGDEVFLISTHQSTGYSAVALPTLTLDLMKNEPNIALGLFGVQSKRSILHRGPFQEKWFEAPFDGSATLRKLEPDVMLVMKRSPQYDFASYAAIPLGYKNKEWLSNASILVPLATFSGIALAALIVLYSKWRLSMLNRLRHALRRDEFFLVYQPIVDLQTGHWVGAEALLRWRHADGTQTNPDIFIPLAERSNLIQQVTAKVIDMFARDTARFLKKNPQFHISLNFSPQDLSDASAFEKLNRVIQQAGIAPHNVTVEVTERVLVQFEQVRQNIQALREAGIKIAIDDFGTGYSGLSYLTKLELDYLKIDKIFVDTIGTDAATSHVVAHIIEIAKSLKLDMIAEGVETAAQAEYLASHGVQYAQGWLYARPMAIEQLIRGMVDRSSD